MVQPIQLDIKPYQLCLYRNRQLEACGLNRFENAVEVISYPFEEQVGGHLQRMVNVRLVPNDPGTLHPVEVERLTPVPKTEYKWVHYAKIDGPGQFPLDMLRFENAVPVNFTLDYDVHDRIVVADHNEDQDLIIAKVTASKPTNWTPNRWTSFLWTLRPMRTLKIQ